MIIYVIIIVASAIIADKLDNIGGVILATIIALIVTVVAIFTGMGNLLESNGLKRPNDLLKEKPTPPVMIINESPFAEHYKPNPKWDLENLKH